MSIYLMNDKTDCCGCGACINVCPRNAISMQHDEYGFAYPHIDDTKCVECKLCEQVCQTAHKNEGKKPLKAFAAHHLNKQVLQQSSSGGIFSALARYFLDNGGAVCGCIFNDKLNAVHICTEKETEFVKIRKSKYLQSDVGLIYRDVKVRLSKGQLVLFTGTPCQISALQAVLGKDYENLLTMDLICHGVPSQRVFDQFIKYLENRYKTKIVCFDFRSKKYGWPRFTLEFTDSHQRTVNIGKTQEFYMSAFTGGNTIRECCLSCRYACEKRIGDITMGDFWGYEKTDLKMCFTGGTSVFTINTPNGEKWLKVLKENVYLEEIDYDLAVKGNHCLHKPTPKGEKRELYMEAIKNDTIEDVARRYRKSKTKQILIEKLKLLVPVSVFINLKKRKKGSISNKIQIKAR